jgi:tripartite-type tricarboxylate transporter receptor subunit TctC
MHLRHPKRRAETAQIGWIMTKSLPRRRSFLALGAVCAAPTIAPLLALPSRAWAETTLPDKTLHILVGFAPGGGADKMARVIAARLERRLGRHVAVENKPGGTAALPGDLLVRGAKDGSVVAFLASTTLASKFVVPDFPFDPLTDLSAITLAGTSETALAVSPVVGASTFADYLQWLKTGDADRRRIGNTSSSAFVEVFGRLISREIDASLQTVAYRGALPMVNDLQSGRLPAGVTALTSLLEHHRGGRLRLLLTSGHQRLPIARDVPTAAELGYPDLEMTEWFGFFASSAVPAPLVAEWNRHLRDVLADREARAELVSLGLDVETSTPEAFTALVASYLSAWKRRLELVGMGPTN